MAINKWLLALGLFILVFIALPFVLPLIGLVGMSWEASFVWALFATFLAATFLFKIKLINKKHTLAATGVFLLGLFAIGGFAPWGFGLQSLGVASIGAGQVAIPPATTPTGCAQGAQNYGELSYATWNAWDQEANTATVVDLTTNCDIYRNGDYVTATTDTSANTESTAYLQVGDTYSVYCGGTTYYTTPIINECVDGAGTAINLDTHKAEAQASMAITGYDDTGVTALSGGTNSSQEDYDITMGADETANFHLKIKVNSADNAFNLGGVAIALTNDAESITMVSGGFTVIPVPKFLKNIQIGGSKANVVSNITDFDTVYRLNTPILLHEWDHETFEFSIESSSTDPATNADFSLSDNIVACFLDSQWAKGSDNIYYQDVFAHTNAQANVGITEDYNIPLGKQTCVVIELI